MTHHNFQKTVSSPLRPLPWPHRTLQTCSWDLSRLILPNHEIHWSSLKSLILKPQFDGQPGFRLRPHPATAATVLKKTQKLGLRFQTVAPDVLNLALGNSNMISQMVYNGLQIGQCVHEARWHGLHFRGVYKWAVLLDDCTKLLKSSALPTCPAGNLAAVGYSLSIGVAQSL